jgi:hypothetical protein
MFISTVIVLYTTDSDLTLAFQPQNPAQRQVYICERCSQMIAPAQSDQHIGSRDDSDIDGFSHIRSVDE